LEVALYPVFYAGTLGQGKDITLGNGVYLGVDSQPYHLIITSASGSWSYKLTKLQTSITPDKDTRAPVAWSGFFSHSQPEKVWPRAAVGVFPFSMKSFQ